MIDRMAMASQVLDEPCTRQSDPSLLELKLRSFFAQTASFDVRKIAQSDSQRIPKIDDWVQVKCFSTNHLVQREISDSDRDPRKGTDAERGLSESDAQCGGIDETMARSNGRSDQRHGFLDWSAHG